MVPPRRLQALVLAVVLVAGGMAACVSPRPYADLTLDQAADTPLQPGDAAAMDALARVFTRFWQEEVFPCPDGDRKAGPTTVEMSIPSSALGAYVADRLAAAAPPAFTITPRPGGNGDGDMPGLAELFGNAALRPDAYASLSVEPKGQTVEIHLMVVGINQLAVCFAAPPGQDHGMPLVLKTVVVAQESLLRTVAHTVGQRPDNLRGRLCLTLVTVPPPPPGAPGPYDRITALSGHSLLPDLMACAYLDDTQPPLACTEVAYDSLLLETDLRAPLPGPRPLILVVKNIDALGNVAYPFDSPHNQTLARLTIPRLPMELLVTGEATLDAGAASLHFSLDRE